MDSKGSRAALGALALTVVLWPGSAVAQGAVGGAAEAARVASAVGRTGPERAPREDAAGGARAELRRRAADGGRWRQVAPEPWLQEDPADSLYRAGRDALNRREFERAAGLFAEIRSRHPRSGYVPDSYYFQAFALQRLGGREREERALALLEEQRARHPAAASRADADPLRVRLQGALARVGDARAAAAVETAARAGCEDDDQELRATALSALIAMDEDRALPILEEVLRSRDECSAALRRQAVFLVARVQGDRAVDLLLDLAHRDPDPDAEVREQAVFWLSGVHTPQAVAALESILRESTDTSVRQQAVFALSREGSPRAIEVLRALAEQPGADRAAREQAIFWLGRDAENGGSEWLRSLYPSLDDRGLKEQALHAIARSGTAADRAWLLERARDAGEDVEVRKNALYWAGEAGLALDELRALYGALAQAELREQVIFVISRREEPAAVDALMQIATEETDPRLREQAVFWLGRSEDPRVGDFLLRLIRGSGR